uniref:Uncharacterized protein n=1 Tax=Lactuca sativa TaxID=4236 RepID=A0A9R1VWS9_LACSA|nr:hypothetical protein LSAT_V11C400222840 [Lactuca sativa]
MNTNLSLLGLTDARPQGARHNVYVSVGLTANSVVNFSGVVGTSVGSRTDVSFDTKTGNFTKYNGDTLTALYYHIVNLLTNTTVSVEVNNDFSSNENMLTIGSQHALDPLTTIKARVNNFRKASALTQHALTLKQIDNGVIVPPSGWKYAKCDMNENI